MGLFLCLSLLPGAVYAQASADEKVAAEALFDQGKKALIDGKLADACEKLEQSQRIDPAVGTLLYLAECYEKSGRTASAWATFREASSAARAGGQPERARIGQERAAKLEPHLVRLTIAVDPADAAIDGFSVKRRGEVIPKALWGVPVPVDPGDHVVEASAPGYQAFSEHVAVDKQAAQLAVPALQKAEMSAAAAPAPGAAAAPGAQPASGPPAGAGSGEGPLAPGASGSVSTSAARPSSGQRTIGIVVGTVGLAGVVVGSIFGLTAISRNNDAKDLCPRGDKCDSPDGADLSDKANHAAVISNVAFGLGGAALVAGGLLFLTAPSTAPATGLHVRILPVVAKDGLGAGMEGSF